MANWRDEFVKDNIPEVDLSKLVINVFGASKTGKTFLYKRLIELLYPDNPEAGMLLAFESGYDTWKIRNVVKCHKYDWKFFKNIVVKNLVAEAKEGTVTKILGIDTVDKLMEMAEDYVLEETNKKYGIDCLTLQEITERKIKGVNGYTLLKKEVTKEISKLRKAGYGLFVTGWTKERKSTTKSGVEFNALEPSMSKTGQSIFMTDAHLICTLFSEVEATDSDGEVLTENEKNKNDKVIVANFHRTKTMMYFREDEYVSCAGGRFTNLPVKIEFSPEGFVEVFKKAIEAQLEDGETVEEIMEIKEREHVESMRELIDEDEKEDIEVLKQQIGTIAKSIEKDVIKRELVPKFKKIFVSTSNYMNVDDIEMLKEALELIKTYE